MAGLEVHAIVAHQAGQRRLARQPGGPPGPIARSACQAAEPLGQLDYVVKGAMIGGFALAAAPAEYGVTGVKTFIVSQDGVVYEKDLGSKTLEVFKSMERFNPDKTWTPVPEE